MKTRLFRTLRSLGLFIALTALINGCSIDANNNELTDADRLGEELEDVIESHDITNVSIYLLNTNSQGDIYYVLRHDRESFILEDQFIQVEEIYYNLGKLVKYEKRLESRPNYLVLYFDIHR